jgi:hypothetical protein
MQHINSARNHRISLLTCTLIDFLWVPRGRRKRNRTLSSRQKFIRLLCISIRPFHIYIVLHFNEFIPIVYWREMENGNAEISLRCANLSAIFGLMAIQPILRLCHGGEQMYKRSIKNHKQEERERRKTKT